MSTQAPKITSLTPEEEQAVLAEQARRNRLSGWVFWLLVLALVVFTMVFIRGLGLFPFQEQDLFRS